MRKPGDIWGQERINRLRELHKQGHSFDVIAAELGVERGAVSGKLHRLGLLGRGVRKEKQPAARRTALRKIIMPPPSPIPVIERQAIAGVSLFDLEWHHCRWPIGEAPYVFCGAAKSESDHRYCKPHSILSRRGVANP